MEIVKFFYQFVIDGITGLPNFTNLPWLPFINYVYQQHLKQVCLTFLFLSGLLIAGDLSSGWVRLMFRLVFIVTDIIIVYKNGKFLYLSHQQDQQRLNQALAGLSYDKA
jgi:hypothetical protein